VRPCLFDILVYEVGFTDLHRFRLKQLVVYLLVLLIQLLNHVVQPPPPRLLFYVTLDLLFLSEEFELLLSGLSRL